MQQMVLAGKTSASGTLLTRLLDVVSRAPYSLIEFRAQLIDTIEIFCQCFQKLHLQLEGQITHLPDNLVVWSVLDGVDDCKHIPGDLDWYRFQLCLQRFADNSEVDCGLLLLRGGGGERERSRTPSNSPPLFRDARSTLLTLDAMLHLEVDCRREIRK